MDYYLLKINDLIFSGESRKYLIFAMISIPLSNFFGILTFSNSMDAIISTIALYYWLLSKPK